MEMQLKMLSFFSLLLFMVSSLNAKVTYLNSLEGEEFEMGNMLEWSTLQEVNTKNFIVEKSIDGAVYTEAGSIEAAGNSGDEKSYSYLDIGANDKKAFYRLRQVDTDGTVSFSHTIVINKQMDNNFAMVNISSTEVRDFLEVSYTSSVDSDMNVELLDEGGSILYSETFAAKKGINEVVLGMDTYTVGNYRVVFTMGMEREVLTIIRAEDASISEPNMMSKKNEKTTKN